MKSRFTLAVVLVLSLLLAGQATASPMSYAFTGTLSTPFNGSNQFSGTVTFEANPPLSGYAANWPPTTPINPSGEARVSLLNESADITLNAGGQTFQFSNQDPNTAGQLVINGVSYAQAQATPSPHPPEDQIGIEGQSRGSDSLNAWSTSFSISFHNLSSWENIADFSTLQFIPTLSEVRLSYSVSNGETYNGSGTITSFTPIETPTPEPSTWLIALLAGGAAALRLRRTA